MNRKSLLYIPIVLLFAFAASALALHYANIGNIQARFSREARLPFGYINARAYSITPPAEAAGIRQGDRIESVTIQGDADALLEAQAARVAEWNKALG